MGGWSGFNIAVTARKIQLFQSFFVKIIMLLLSLGKKAVILAGKGVRLSYFLKRNKDFDGYEHG